MKVLFLALLAVAIGVGVADAGCGIVRGRLFQRRGVSRSVTTVRMSAPRAMIRMSGACANGQCEVPMSQKK